MEVKETAEIGRRLSPLRQAAWGVPLLLSVALVIPCCWQPIVSSADLQSHLYNAWLAQLIESGSIHGLWIGHQSTNVLLDLLLPWLLRLFGISGAEKVTCALCILIFFWGAFHLISSVRGERPAYWLAPWVAILCYGFVFQMGFLNYYLSCGIVLWLAAILWRQRVGWRILWSAPMLIMAYLAHPMPVLWFLALGAYCWIGWRLPLRFQMLLLLGGVGSLILIRVYLTTRYLTIWEWRQIMCVTGADQALLYGWADVAVAGGFLLFLGVLLNEPENRRRALVSLPAQAYFLTAIATVVMPSSIQTSLAKADASIIPYRLSLLSGVLLLAMISRSAYRRWYLAAGLAAAVVFFAALYHDIGRESAVEAKMQRLVETLPAGERVVSYVDLSGRPDDSYLATRYGRIGRAAKLAASILTERINPTHLISRACLGHCFDYMDYEPSTGQFRIHAAPGNSIVMAKIAEYQSMEFGTYAVKASDLPLYAVFRCGPGSPDIRMRRMMRGETGAHLACAETDVAP